MQYKITVNEPHFSYIKSGQKIYEGRRYYRNVLKYKIGDTLCITKHSSDESINATIVGLYRFATFEEALSSLPLRHILPNANSVAEGIEIYKQFVSIDTQLRDGVCMIKLKFLD